MKVLAVIHSPDAGPELFEEVLAEGGTSSSSGTSGRTGRRHRTSMR
ncbi:MAG: hypothetical protein ACXVQQ_04635 [Gaiellaceae bacterium]